MPRRTIVSSLAPLLAPAAACAIALAAAALPAGCASTPPRPARINHVVFFTLANPADADALIRECDERLATIPGITSYYCGPPLDTGRETVLADYDVGFYVGFDSLDDYENYIEHPQHQAMVADWRPRLESLHVRDVVDETR